MSRFAKRIAPFVEVELVAAEQARGQGRVREEFAYLERAHVLGQASTYWHVKVHVLMLRWAWRNRAAREGWGQCLRIIGAAALTAPGWVPQGNTGGANVSPVKPMPLPADLAASIRTATSSEDWRGVIVTESIELETPRLTLGQWRDEDLPVFAELNADPEIMRYFPSCLSREDSDAMAARCKALIADNGWGFWAVRLRDSGAFIGFVGLNRPIVELPFSPCVEIGWRLHSAYWGKGYATEAARRALAFAFTDLALDEVVSFTATSNTPSQAVMQRLGMRNTGRNFLHPAVPASHPLEEHVLFTLGADEWFASQH